MAQLKSEFSEDLRFVYRHFPLSSHDKAMLTAQATEAADLQGQFWEMHDLIFETQVEWSSLSPEDFQEWIEEQAAELDLDVAQFMTDLDSAAVIQRVERDLNEAQALGLPGTPTLVINGQYYSGPLDAVNLGAIINLIKLEDRQFSECPPTVIDPAKQYRAILKTDKGDITLDLYSEQAPLTVNNFIFLVENDWYDGITFHRVLEDYVAQAGDPTGTGFGGPGFAYVNEIDPSLRFDKPGVLAMANAGPDSNGSQFFITYGPQEQLNDGYTIFGQVVDGLDVLEQLTPRDPSTDPGAPPGDLILDVVIEEQ